MVSRGWLRGVTLLFVLLAVAAIAVGYVAGAPPSGHDGPSVDPSDDPAVVAADALAQVRNRSANVTLYWSVTNETSGERTGGVLLTAAVQPDQRRFDGRVWRDVFRERTNRSDPATHLYATRFVRFTRSPGDDWSRRTPGAPPVVEPVRRPDVLRTNASTVDVVVRNDSTLVVRITDDAVVSALTPTKSAEGDQTATVVVALGDDPHLERYEATWRTEDGVGRYAYVYHDVGDVSVDRPGDVPPTTPREFVGRVVHGWQRLADAVGL